MLRAATNRWSYNEPKLHTGGVYLLIEWSFFIWVQQSRISK